MLIKKLITMTESKYNKLVTRIFWFTLPLIISLLTFLVVNTFTLKTEIGKITTSQQASNQTENRMWEMVQQNNIILSTKADESENRKDHLFIIEKMDNMDKKMDYITGRKDYTYNKTVYPIIPYKNLSIVSNDKQKSNE
jgi:hypothetical protein